MPFTRRRSLFVLGGVALAGLLLIGIRVLPGVLGATSPAGNELRRIFQATYITPASYVQVVERGPAGNREREEFKVWQSGWNRKVVQISPAPLAGFTVVQRGPLQTVYAEGFPEVLRTRFPGSWPFGREEGRPPRRRPRITETFGHLTDRRPTRIVSILDGRQIRVRFWVDPKSNFVLRQERYGRDGEVIDVTENRALVRQPAGLQAALKPQPPAGTTQTSDARRWRLEYLTFVLRREAPYPFLVPSKPLAGWQLVRAWPFEAEGTKVVALQFVREHAGFTLFEFPVGSAKGFRPQEPPHRFHSLRKPRYYSVTRDGLVAVAVGNLSAAQARQLFASFKKIYPVSGRESSAANRTQGK